MNCEGCPLNGRPKVQGYGPHGKYVIVGEAPGYNEVAKGRPFVGESGRLLRTTLRGAGLDPDLDVYYTNAVLCNPPENKTPSETIWRHCRDRLVTELQDVQPLKILSLGAIPLSSLLDRAVTITPERNIGRWYESTYLMPTFHPANILRTPDNFRDFDEDIKKWLRLDAPIEPPRIYLSVAEDAETVVTTLNQFMKAPVVSLDLETTGVDFWKERTESIGFGALIEDPDYDFYCLIIPIDLLDESSVVQLAVFNFVEQYSGEMALHNIKFDVQFLEEFYKTQIFLKHPVDTMLMSYAHDERGDGKFGVHKLKHLSRRYDIRDYKFSFNKFYALPKEERDYQTLYNYQSIDCYVTAKLKPDLEKELQGESPRLMELVSGVLIPAALTYGEAERHGTLIDRPYLEKLREEYSEILSTKLNLLQHVAKQIDLHEDPIEFDPTALKSLKILSKIYPRDRERVVQEYLGLKKAILEQNQYWMARYTRILLGRAAKYGLYNPGSPFNPDSSAQALAFVRGLGVETKSTEKESLWLALSQASNLPEENRKAVEELIDYRVWSKIMSTYILGLLEKADENDRAHPDYLVHGSVTGRPACHDPNLQNIPQVVGPQIRNAFIAPPDFWFISADYSQLELRIAASLSHDVRMLAAYAEGRDLHREVAAAMFKKPPEEITFFERYLAKYVDFGVIYGRGAKSLVEGWEMEHLAQQGGRRWTIREAEIFIDAFLNQFPDLKRWIARQRELVQTQQYIETRMGRRRRFPLILPKFLGGNERQAINTPIQSLASDLTMTAIARLQPRLAEYDTHILFTVYDSIEFEAPKGSLSKVVPIIKYEMEENLPLELECPIRADVEVGHRWGELEAYDPARHI